MFGWHLAFDRPWYLLLLLLLPLLWVFSFRSLAGLGRWRRFAALALRTSVFLLVILSLAEMQRVQVSEKLTVLYVLDQSESIPSLQRQAMLEYVVAEVREHRNVNRGDKAGVIIFGRDANIEVAPYDDDLPSRAFETLFNLKTDATNLAAALKLAQASFPEDSARRVVIVTDGNENLGDARSIARALVDQGIGVDVVPAKLASRSEVAVEKVTLPADIRKGQKFEARVVLHNFAQAKAGNSGHVKGKLVLSRNSGGHSEQLAEQPVELKPGKNVLQFADDIDQADFYTYEARFVADSGDDDRLTENNRATAFTHVRGKGHVLLIENADSRGEFDHLISRLRNANIEVTVQATDSLFNSLAELQRFDSVVLANVPRSAEADIDKTNNAQGAAAGFTDERIAMLVRNTQQMGSGIVMLGGPQSFGAGGWAGTELEKAMPVDFTIKNHKVAPVGALVMVMHASEMAQGNYWQKVIGEQALKSLGQQDYCGVVHWNGTDVWLWKDQQTGMGLTRVGSEQNRQAMLARVGRMQPGDMPDFDPAMLLAANDFAALGTKAAIKHMIIISDGDPAPPNKGVQALIKAGATCTTVAVGTHGPPSQTPLIQIAQQTGGKFYNVTNANALPRIYQREARRVAQPLIFDKETVQPRVKFPHEMVQGVEGPIPPIKGFVLTTVKDNPLVEVSLVSPKPADEANATLLASWTFGLGRTAVLTTDAGRRWASGWTDWEHYDKLYSQIVRWSMRPINEAGKFTVATDVKDGKVRVSVTALDQNDEFLNFLKFGGSIVGPNMDSGDVGMRQVAPGRYVGEFDAPAPGSYFLTLAPGPGKAPIRTGINVPYSAEYRDRETNVALLNDLVALTPQGGEQGQLIDGELTKAGFQQLLAVDTFRHNLVKATSSQGIWPYLLWWGACLFLADVFVRRVALGTEWLKPVMKFVRERVFRREVQAPVEERLARLRSRKQAVTQSLDERRAQTRFEPQAEAEPPPLLDPEAALRAPPAPPSSRPSLAPQAAEEGESYTDRLRKAKEKAWKDREKPS